MMLFCLIMPPLIYIKPIIVNYFFIFLFAMWMTAYGIPFIHIYTYIYLRRAHIHKREFNGKRYLWWKSWNRAKCVFSANVPSETHNEIWSVCCGPKMPPLFDDISRIYLSKGMLGSTRSVKSVRMANKTTSSPRTIVQIGTYLYQCE